MRELLLQNMQDSLKTQRQELDHQRYMLAGGKEFVKENI